MPRTLYHSGWGNPWDEPSVWFLNEQYSIVAAPPENGDTVHLMMGEGGCGSGPSVPIALDRLVAHGLPGLSHNLYQNDGGGGSVQITVNSALVENCILSGGTICLNYNSGGDFVFDNAENYAYVWGWEQANTKIKVTNGSINHGFLMGWIEFHDSTAASDSNFDSSLVRFYNSTNEADIYFAASFDNSINFGTVGSMFNEYYSLPTYYATFTGLDSGNAGTIYGPASFDDWAVNQGWIQGDASFDHNARHSIPGEVTGLASFDNGSYWDAPVATDSMGGGGGNIALDHGSSATDGTCLNPNVTIELRNGSWTNQWIQFAGTLHAYDNCEVMLAGAAYVVMHDASVYSVGDSYNGLPIAVQEVVFNDSSIFTVLGQASISAIWNSDADGHDCYWESMGCNDPLALNYSPGQTEQFYWDGLSFRWWLYDESSCVYGSGRATQWLGYSNQWALSCDLGDLTGWLNESWSYASELPDETTDVTIWNDAWGPFGTLVCRDCDFYAYAPIDAVDITCRNLTMPSYFYDGTNPVRIHALQTGGPSSSGDILGAGLL